MPATNAEICLDFVLHHETEHMIVVSVDGIEAHAKWLEKSKAEIFRGTLTAAATRQAGDRTVLPVVAVSLSERLARAKGLI